MLRIGFEGAHQVQIQQIGIKIYRSLYDSVTFY